MTVLYIREGGESRPLFFCLFWRKVFFAVYQLITENGQNIFKFFPKKVVKKFVKSGKRCTFAIPFGTRAVF